MTVVATSPNRGRLYRWAGVAAALGGACWVIKGGVIMLGGDQPRVLFEAGPPLFVIGLLGLSAGLAVEARAAKIGGLLAYAGGAMIVLTGILYALGALELSEESFSVGSAVVLATFLAITGSLVLLGAAIRGTHALGPRWDVLPLVMGVNVLPMVLAGGILRSLDERLFELPIVLFGSAWVVLGYLMWSTRSQRAPAKGRSGSA